MSNFFFFFLTLLAGMALAVQAGLNSQLRLAVGNPIFSSILSFSVGLTALLLFLVLLRPPNLPALTSLTQITWWKWLGGTLGAFYIVVAILTAPKIGAAGFTGLLIAGQLIASLLLDHFGWVGFKTQPVSWTKIGGAAFLLLGVYLIVKK